VRPFTELAIAPYRIDRRMSRRAALAACASWLAVAPLAAQTTAAAGATDAGGVLFAPTVQVGGQLLRLNGAGVRWRAVVKVYSAGLYLPGTAPVRTTADALQASGGKRVHLVMHRDIDATELGRLFTRAIEDNTPRADVPRLVPGMLQFADIFSQVRQLKAGDAVSVDWLPGAGTVVLVRGQPVGQPIKEPDFYSAVLRIWLGDQPADGRLKEALLGRGG
jgi:hypothetical protein